MAYLELLLRCVTPRGLLRAVLHFLFTYEYDGFRILDVLLKRLDGNSQLSLISLALMETLIDLNCEDVMIELAYKHLLNGHHLMMTHRHIISDPEPYRDAAVAFLALSPRCCSRPIEKTREWVDDLALSGRRVLDFKDDENRRINGVYDGIAMNSLVREAKFNYGNPNETLYGNYHAYLCDARFEIVSRTIACSNWSSRYDAIMPLKREPNNNSTKETKETEGLLNAAKELDSLVSICTSGYDTLKTSDTSEKEAHSLNSLTENFTGNGEPDKVISEIDKVISENQNETDRAINQNESEIKVISENHSEADKVINENQSKDNKVLGENQSELKEHDSLTLEGESCGYDSFRCKVDETEDEFTEDSFRKCLREVQREVQEYDSEVPSIKSWRRSAESIIGPLLSSLLKKAANLLEADITSNCRVTSAISKLAALPTPLLTSLLLCPGFVLQPNVPSLFQILSKLREEVDELTNGLDNTCELVDKARVFLIQREMALAKTRGPNKDDGQSHTQPSAQKTEESPFKRGESKRRSLSNSFSMLARRLSSSSPIQHSNHSIQNTPHINTPQKRLVFTQEAYWDQSITLRSILNAVILDEWIKELASLCEEHALRLSADNYEDDTYIKTVAL